MLLLLCWAHGYLATGQGSVPHRISIQSLEQAQGRFQSVWCGTQALWQTLCPFMTDIVKVTAGPSGSIHAQPATGQCILLLAVNADLAQSSSMG